MLSYSFSHATATMMETGNVMIKTIRVTARINLRPGTIINCIHALPMPYVRVPKKIITNARKATLPTLITDGLRRCFFAKALVQQNHVPITKNIKTPIPKKADAHFGKAMLQDCLQTSFQ